MEREEITLDNDLGSFEGFSFRNQCAIMKILTAEEVVNWDHDRQGEAEFWPHGDNELVAKVFRNKSAVCASELVQLDELLSSVSEYDHIKIIYAMEEGYSLDQLDSSTLDDLNLYVFSGSSFMDLEKEAAWELFEAFYPELCKAVNESPCSGVHFDPESFLQDFSTSEIEYDGEKVLVVCTQ